MHVLLQHLHNFAALHQQSSNVFNQSISESLHALHWKYGFDTCHLAFYKIFSIISLAAITQAQKQFSIFLFVRVATHFFVSLFTFFKRACESPWNLIIIKTTKCDELERKLKLKVFPSISTAIKLREWNSDNNSRHWKYLIIGAQCFTEINFWLFFREYDESDTYNVSRAILFRNTLNKLPSRVFCETIAWYGGSWLRLWIYRNFSNHGKKAQTMLRL